MEKSVLDQSSSTAIRQSWVTTYSDIILVGLVLSVLYHGLRSGFGNYYPQDTFLFRPSDRFGDFKNWIQYEKYRLPEQWALPPLSLVFATLWKLIASVSSPFVSFILYSMTALLIHCRIVFVELRDRVEKPTLQTWIILSLFTYPVIFALDRGNQVWVVYLCTYFFLYFCNRNKFNKAAFFLAIAASFKILPLFMVLYLFWKKQWIAAIYTGAWTVFLSISSYFIISHFVLRYSIALILEGLKANVHRLAIVGDGIPFSHSLHSLIRVVSDVFLRNHIQPTEAWHCQLLDLSNVLSFMMLAAAGVWAFLNRSEVQDWKIASILIVFQLLIPHVSGDYYLLYGYLLFFCLLRGKEWSKYLKLYSICLGLLMIPKAYFVFMGEVNLGVLLNPILLLMMLACLLFSEAGTDFVPNCTL